MRGQNYRSEIPAALPVIGARYSMSVIPNTKAVLDASPSDAYVSANRTCDIGLLDATGALYQSFVFLLEELARLERPLGLDEA
jgi:hypothetical protein